LLVLLDHVTRDREQIRLRASNVLVNRGTQEPHKDLLGEIGYVRRMRQPKFEKTTQAIAVLSGHAGDELPFLGGAQSGSRRLDFRLKQGRAIREPKVYPLGFEALARALFVRKCGHNEIACENNWRHVCVCVY
jgi:hypothetical protein